MQKPKKTNILLVDKQVLLTECLHLELERRGFIITGEAKNANEALEILKNKNTDVLICAVELPGMDGIDLIKKAKNLYPDMKFIALSDHCDKYKVNDAFKAGATGYRLKSISVEFLVEAINKVMGGNPSYCDELAHIWQLKNTWKMALFG